MLEALALATQGLGNVWPNPAVGCVIERDGKAVGAGWTQPGGRPHAEFMALERAGPEARGATAFVTLEPCAHEGETPSCARLLAEAGVKRVIYAVADPDSRTSGKGALFLEEKGIEVREGLFSREAFRINQGFFTKISHNRPMITLKVAVSRDGKIAEREGVRTPITGEQTNLFTQKVRAKYDAILVGIGTVLADDPTLRCRIQGLEDQSPVRIILDRTLKIPPKSNLVKSAKKTPLWIITEARDIPFALTRNEIEIVQVKNIKKLDQIVEIIAEKGITRLLVEGGATVHTSFFESALADYIYVMQNQVLELGEDGVPAFRNPKIYRKGEIRGFERLESNALGEDVIDFWARKD